MVAFASGAEPRDGLKLRFSKRLLVGLTHSAETQGGFPTGFNSTHYAMLKAFENPIHLLRTGLLTKNPSLLPLRGESFPCGKENIWGAASFPLLRILSTAWV